MLALSGAVCLIFVCDDLLALGLYAANNAERDAVTLSCFILSPMGAALAAFFTSVITHFAVKKSVPIKVLAPLVVAFLAMPCGLGCTAFFYEAI